MQTLRMLGKSAVEWTDDRDPEPGPGEVLIETAVTLLCGSELHAYRQAGMPRGNLGHEAAGTVKQLGAGVTTLKLGQRVGASAISGCGTCQACQKQQFTWCVKNRFYGNMHAERFVVAAAACNPLPDDLAWDLGVLLSGDGLGVPYHTSRKITSPDIRTVAVFGAGPIGLGNVLLQAHLGRRVIVVDISDYRLDLARKLGASDTVNPKHDDAVKAIRTLTADAGPDVCIEAAGRSETALQCFAAVRTGGTVAFNGEQAALPLSPSDHFIRRDITAFGSWYYHFSECPEMLALHRNGLPTAKLITHHYPHTQAPAAFENFSAGLTGKVVLHYAGEK